MTAPLANRAEAARQWIARQKAPQSTRDFINALQPKGDASRWSATLSQLVKAGHLVRHGSGRSCTYSAAPPKAARPAAKQQTSGKRPKPKRESQIRIAPARPALDAPKAPRAAERESVEAFLSRGGCIQRLEPHEVSEPLRFQYNPSPLALPQRRARGRGKPANTCP